MIWEVENSNAKSCMTAGFQRGGWGGGGGGGHPGIPSPMKFKEYVALFPDLPCSVHITHANDGTFVQWFCHSCA